MNDLYLIGNGFDLAHGLKTSYNDFLLWYLNDFFKSAFRKDHYEDDLLKIDRQGLPYNLPSDFSSVKDISQKLKDLNYKLKAKHDFLGGIVNNYRDFKWVDIEYEYYKDLIKIFRYIEEDRYNDGIYIGGLKPLNDCFESIKKKLTEYLQTIIINSKQFNSQIESILLEKNGVNGNGSGEKLFVNFNYTKTLELYAGRKFLTKYNIVNIHGDLVDPSNPVIFGYGDEMDPFYEKMENLNTNEFLKNIKSFGYFRTEYYQRVLRFINGQFKPFTVKILGHSCGLSDRILLNTIFEHPNCKAIKIYYYEKSEMENDYFEKTQEISRHFRASMKGKMREKIVSFEKSIPLPQNQKDN